MGAEGGDGSGGEDVFGPWTGGDENVGRGEGVGFGGGFVGVCYRFDAGGWGGGVVCYLGDGSEDYLAAAFGGQVGHGGGELVRVHLRGVGGVAHLIVGAYRVGRDPVQVFRYAGGAEETDGCFRTFLKGDGFASI